MGTAARQIPPSCHLHATALKEKCVSWSKLEVTGHTSHLCSGHGDDILQNSRPRRAAGSSHVHNVLQTPPSCGAADELRSGPQIVLLMCS